MEGLYNSQTPSKFALKIVQPLVCLTQLVEKLQKKSTINFSETSTVYQRINYDQEGGVLVTSTYHYALEIRLNLPTDVLSSVHCTALHIRVMELTKEKVIPILPFGIFVAGYMETAYGPLQRAAMPRTRRSLLFLFKKKRKVHTEVSFSAVGSDHGSLVPPVEMLNVHVELHPGATLSASPDADARRISVDSTEADIAWNNCSHYRKTELSNLETTSFTDEVFSHIFCPGIATAGTEGVRGRGWKTRTARSHSLLEFRNANPVCNGLCARFNHLIALNAVTDNIKGYLAAQSNPVGITKGDENVFVFHIRSTYNEYSSGSP
ncbi:hypothetical protein H4582DRAFT_2056426 [Lactarius indigo]|nr:hypothetical protein H4582DRAFT_2056426 [Lactarius indigo]